jgi:hypothetical protein
MTIQADQIRTRRQHKAAPAGGTIASCALRRSSCPA